MNEIFDSLKSYISEKTENPLVTGFCISWLIWNYKMVIALFSGAELSEKMSYIRELYSSHTNFLSFNIDSITNAYSTGLVYPIITTLIYIYLVPVFSKKIISYHYTKSTELRNAKITAEDKKTLTVEESRKLIADKNSLEFRIQDLESKHVSEIKTYKEAIKVLNESNEELKKQNSELSIYNATLINAKSILEKDINEAKEILKPMISDLSNSKENQSEANPTADDKISKNFLLYILSNDSSLTLQALSLKTHQNKVKLEFLFRELINENLVEASKIAGVVKYSLTEFGKKFVVDNKLYDMNFNDY